MRIKHPIAEKLRLAYGARTSQINMRDANAARQVAFSETDFSYSIQVTMRVEKRKTQVHIGADLACISVFDDFDVPRFTMNAADQSGFKSKNAGTVRIGTEIVEVFTEDGTLSDLQRRILDSEEMRKLLSAHVFRSGEAMHFYRNVLVLYARNEDITPDLVALVTKVADTVPTSSTSEPP